MPDALELLNSRRSVKPIEMTGPGPDARELEKLLTIASRVPDHGKLAPWRFIVFEGEARDAAGEVIAKRFAAEHPEATAEQLAFERNRLARAPLVIAVVSRAAPHVKIPEWEQQLSAGAAAMALVVGAHAMGFAASWITEWYAYDRAVLDGLGLDAHERIAGFVHIGRPRKPPEERDRPKPLFRQPIDPRTRCSTPATSVTAVSCRTIRSRQFSRRGRSVGFRRSARKARSILRPSPSSTASIADRLT